MMTDIKLESDIDNIGAVKLTSLVMLVSFLVVGFVVMNAHRGTKQISAHQSTVVTVASSVGSPLTGYSGSKPIATQLADLPPSPKFPSIDRSDTHIKIKDATEKEHHFDAVIARAATMYQIDRYLIKAVIHAESYFDPEAVSRAGAQGLMQIMPATAASLKLKDPFHPEQNIMSGTRFLARLLDKYDDDEDLALAAYNAGEGTVAKYNGIPPYRETRTYVKKVKRWKKTYKNRATKNG